MKSQKEVQKPVESCNGTQGTGDAVALEVGEMNYSTLLDSGFPPLQQEMLENRSQKKDMTPGPKVPLKSKAKSVHHFDFGVPMMFFQPPVSNSSQPGQPVTVPRPPVIMPKLKKLCQKKDMTPGPKVPLKSKAKSVHHFDFGVPMMFFQQPVSNSSQPGQPVTVPRPPVIMPKLKNPPKVNQLKAAAGPRPQPVLTTKPLPSTTSVAGTSDLWRECAQLDAKKAVLLQETEKLKVVLETVNDQVEKAKALLYKVADQKQQKIQTEKLLAAQLAETERLKEELAQAQKELEEEKLHREEEMSRLQNEYNKTTSMMKAAAMKAEEDLENERSEWLQERSAIQAALKTLKASIDETAEEKDKFISDVMSQVHHLEQTQEKAQNKSKKRSLWKTFKQLFKRS